MNQHNKQVRWSRPYWCWVVCICIVLGTGWPCGASSENQCVLLYRGQKLLEAALCFEKLAQGLARQGSTRRRVMRGRALRNAASLLVRVAQKSSDAGKASWWRERAATLLQSYLHEKLYELSEHQQSVTLQLYELRQRIGYGHLTVVAHEPEARIQIEGHKLKSRGTGRWSRRVRPGTYVITSTNQRGATDQRRISLPPGGVEVVVFAAALLSTPTSPPKASLSRSRRIISWTLFGIGGGMLIGGVAFLGAAEGVDHQKVQQNLDLLAHPEWSLAIQRQSVKQIEGLQGQAQALYALGWSVLCMGVFAALGGGLVRWWPRPLSKPVTPPSAPLLQRKSLGTTQALPLYTLWQMR